MTFASRQLSFGFVFASILGGFSLAACGSAAGDPGAPGTSSQAVNCASGGIHVEDCFDPGPITIPKPPEPRPATCISNPLCAMGPVKPDFATTGFDPGYSPSVQVQDGLKGFWGVDPSFATDLATNNCTPERYYYPPTVDANGVLDVPGTTSDRVIWATTICPVSYLPPSGVTAGIIACDQCTDTPPNTDYRVIAWAIAEPVRLPGSPPISSEGCDEDTCDGICNDLSCLQSTPALQ